MVTERSRCRLGGVTGGDSDRDGLPASSCSVSFVLLETSKAEGVSSPLERERETSSRIVGSFAFRGIGDTGAIGAVSGSKRERLRDIGSVESVRSPIEIEDTVVLTIGSGDKVSTGTGIIGTVGADGGAGGIGAIGGGIAARLGSGESSILISSIEISAAVHGIEL